MKLLNILFALGVLAGAANAVTYKSGDQLQVESLKYTYDLKNESCSLTEELKLAPDFQLLYEFRNAIIRDFNNGYLLVQQDNKFELFFATASHCDRFKKDMKRLKRGLM